MSKKQSGPEQTSGRSVSRREFLAASIAAAAAACEKAAQPESQVSQPAPGDPLSLDALGQAELVRGKQVQPIELVEAVIERIEKLNPRLNAIVTPMYDLALQAAREKIPEGPFSGVPFLLKDLGAAYAGVRHSAGSRALANYLPPQDSELVVRYKRAGLLIVGKTNTPEFGLTATTEPHLFGAARNPWNLARTTGGSSGGSAAAVAARIVPMAHASDGGGSIRIPASCCGLFGLKPTRARNTLAPAGDIMNGLVAEHAVTLTVRDSAALLDATAGPHPGDPYFAPPKQRPFLEEVGADPGRLRIAFSTQAPGGAPVHPDCQDAVGQTAKLLEGLGYQVEEAAPQVEADRYKQAFMTLWLSGLASTIESLSASSGLRPSLEIYEPVTLQLYQKGAQFRAFQYLDAVKYLQALSRRFAAFFETYDMWLTPTVAEPPVRLGVLHPGPEVSAPDADKTVERAFQFVPFTHFANVTGQPAMSMPLYWNAEGLPVGVHFFGRFGDEAGLFRLAAQLEQAQPWISRIPPVAAGV